MDNSTHNYILLHLQKHGSITPLDALWEYGCYRLSSVINRLRRDHIITTEPTEGKTKRGKKYTFATYCYWGKREDFYKNYKTP